MDREELHIWRADFNLYVEQKKKRKNNLYVDFFIVLGIDASNSHVAQGSTVFDCRLTHGEIL